MTDILRNFMLLWCLSLIAWIDWRTKRIPNTILLFMIAAESMFLSSGCLLDVQGQTEVLAAASGFLTGGAIFFVCYLVFKGGIGAGDVKLSAVIGLYLGSRKIVMVSVLAFVLAAGSCVFLLLLKRTALRQKIPFAPFLVAAAVIVIFLEI